jgi:hypothetical protein
VIGLTRWVQKLNLKTHASAAQAFARFVSRTDVAVAWPVYYEAFFKDLCDRVVVGAFKVANGPSVKVKTTSASWCNDNFALCTSLFDPIYLKAAIAANGDFKPIASTLNKLVSTGEAGLLLWSFALIRIIAEEVDAVVEYETCYWLSNGPMTQLGLDQAKSKILGLVTAIENFDLIPMKRIVLLTCGGLEFSIETESAVHLISCSLSFGWRPMAVVQSKLSKLFCHDVVLTGCRPYCATAIADSLSKGPESARSQCNINFSEQGALSGVQTAALIKKTLAQYTVVDPDFDADCQLIMSVCGANSEARLLLAIEKECPKASEYKTPENVLHAVCAMVATPVFKLASKPAQVKHAAFKKVLMSIVNESSPDLVALKADKAMTNLVSALPNFVRHTPAAASGSAVSTLVGLDALNALLKVAEAKVANGGTLREADVEQIKTFMFLIPLNMRKEFNDVVEAARADTGAKLRKGGKKAAGCKDKAVSEAMAMFS